MWFLKRKRYAHVFTFLYGSRNDMMQKVYNSNNKDLTAEEWNEWTTSFEKEQNCIHAWVVINHSVVTI